MTIEEMKAKLKILGEKKQDISKHIPCIVLINVYN